MSNPQQQQQQQQSELLLSSSQYQLYPPSIVTTHRLGQCQQYTPATDSPLSSAPGSDSEQEPDDYYCNDESSPSIAIINNNNNNNSRRTGSMQQPSLVHVLPPTLVLNNNNNTTKLKQRHQQDVPFDETYHSSNVSNLRQQQQQQQQQQTTLAFLNLSSRPEENKMDDKNHHHAPEDERMEHEQQQSRIRSTTAAATFGKEEEEDVPDDEQQQQQQQIPKQHTYPHATATTATKQQELLVRNKPPSLINNNSLRAKTTGDLQLHLHNLATAISTSRQPSGGNNNSMAPDMQQHLNFAALKRDILSLSAKQQLSQKLLLSSRPPPPPQTSTSDAAAAARLLIGSNNSNDSSSKDQHAHYGYHEEGAPITLTSTLTSIRSKINLVSPESLEKDATESQSQSSPSCGATVASLHDQEQTLPDQEQIMVALQHNKNKQPASTTTVVPVPTTTTTTTGKTAMNNVLPDTVKHANRSSSSNMAAAPAALPFPSLVVDPITTTTTQLQFQYQYPYPYGASPASEEISFSQTSLEGGDEKDFLKSNNNNDDNDNVEGKSLPHDEKNQNSRALKILVGMEEDSDNDSDGNASAPHDEKQSTPSAQGDLIVTSTNTTATIDTINRPGEVIIDNWNREERPSILATTTTSTGSTKSKSSPKRLLGKKTPNATNFTASSSDWGDYLKGRGMASGGSHYCYVSKINNESSSSWVSSTAGDGGGDQQLPPPAQTFQTTTTTTTTTTTAAKSANPPVYRLMTPKKDLLSSENSAWWLQEEFSRRCIIKKEINQDILLRNAGAGTGTGLAARPLSRITSRARLTSAIIPAPSANEQASQDFFAQELVNALTNLPRDGGDHYESIDDEEVAAYTEAAYTEDDEGPNDEFLYHDGEDGEQKIAMPRRLKYDTMRDKVSGSSTTGSASAGHTRYASEMTPIQKKHRHLSDPLGARKRGPMGIEQPHLDEVIGPTVILRSPEVVNDRIASEAGLSSEMQRFASDTRAALRGKIGLDTVKKLQKNNPSTDGSRVAYSTFRSIAVASSMDSHGVEAALPDKPQPSVLSENSGLSNRSGKAWLGCSVSGEASVGSSRTGGSDFAEAHSNVAPVFIQSMDSFHGIPKGDITLSLLNENTGRIETSQKATWAGRVHGAIWRGRQVRRSVGGFGEHDPTPPGSPSKARSSLPIDLDKGRVSGGFRNVSSTQDAALLHLRHDEIDEALLLFEDIIFAYYSYFENSLKRREQNPHLQAGLGTTDFKPYIGVALHNLGILNLLNGEYKEALSFFTRAVDNRKACLGEGHPDHVVSNSIDAKRPMADPY
jgi:hypothetical protein